MKAFFLWGALFCLLFSGTLVAAASLSPAEKESIQKSISSNESMAARFRSQIAKIKDKDEVVRLESKTAVLRDETQKLRARLSGEERAPVKAPQKLFEDLKGEDWAHMSKKERERFVYTCIGGLQRQGVFVLRLPDDYLQALDKILAADPVLKSEYLEDLFVFCVHDAEPQTRDAIRNLREKSDGKTL